MITRRKRLRGPVLGIANVMQTIPSLALFGFLIPLPFGLAKFQATFLQYLPKPLLTPVMSQTRPAVS